MNYKESERKFEKIKFEVELMSTVDLCALAHKLTNEIDEIKAKLFQTNEDKGRLWFKKRILKMTKKVIRSRQMILF